MPTANIANYWHQNNTLDYQTTKQTGESKSYSCNRQLQPVAMGQQRLHLLVDPPVQITLALVFT